MGSLTSTFARPGYESVDNPTSNLQQRNFKQVTSLSGQELADIVRLASTAFGDKDDSMLALLGGDIALKDEFLTAMVRATLLEGAIYIVEVDSELVSASLWFRKPVGLFKSEAQRALGYDEWFKKLPEDLQSWWTVDYSTQMRDYSKTIIDQEEWDKIWYCNLMVTDVDQQNQGHATFMMDQMTARVREAGEMLGLSAGSEINVSKYESMGFRERGRIALRSLVNEIPCVWLTKE
ncbi:unnamed protein product [Peniophora sp. CBMAI 1063]|nr:unnamed protein product [Peniophora sp. CBMAI 1063]